MQLFARRKIKQIQFRFNNIFICFKLSLLSLSNFSESTVTIFNNLRLQLLTVSS